MGEVLGKMNWVDWVIVGFCVYQVYEGWGRGFVGLVMELGGFVGSLIVALKLYGIGGEFLVDKFGFPPGWGKLVSFLALSIVVEGVLVGVARSLYLKIPQRWISSRVNSLLGVVPSILNGLLITSFVLLVILGLPIKGSAKRDVRQSMVGSFLVGRARAIEMGAKSIFGEAVAETVEFLTVNPGSKERVELGYQLPGKELAVDERAEGEMLTLLNAERRERGLRELVVERKVVEVARKHSRDMWERGYFSHVNPEGEGPGERLKRGGVTYGLAGENLALAPDVKAAHKGLMESEGHRRNILDPDFRKIGIGVIAGGDYGVMFTQNFTD